jgi:hypothetical protein
MRFPALNPPRLNRCFCRLLSCCCLVAFSTPAWGWLGIKSRPGPFLHSDSARTKAALPAKPVQPKAIPTRNAAAPAMLSAPPDTRLSGKPQSIPAGYPGTYLGILEGVRCFNCAPDMVLLNVGDTLSREASIVALRTEVWNAIERPVKDRRLFDHDGRCFYFGHADSDSALVGGVWTEIRLQSVPCYPYLHRDLQSRSPSLTTGGSDGSAPQALGNPGKTAAESTAQAARTAFPAEEN